MLESSHELAGAAARCRASLQSVRRLRATKDPWVGAPHLLAAPASRKGASLASLDVHSPGGTSSDSTAVGGAGVALFESRRLTTELCREVFCCSASWEPDPALLDGVMTRGTPGAETTIREEDFGPFCFALLRASTVTVDCNRRLSPSTVTVECGRRV